MEVDDPGEVHLILIPEMRIISCTHRERESPDTVARNAEIFFRTSASSITVSLNPGVSIKITG